MPIQYKIDVLFALKEKGFTTYRIRKDKLLSESTVQKLRNQNPIAWENIETLCELLHCQPGDIMEYVEEGTESNDE
ncbi:MAG: helix-turn-helix domain-containing protein [Acutalibacteraceae bacterium]